MRVLRVSIRIRKRASGSLLRTQREPEKIVSGQRGCRRQVLVISRRTVYLQFVFYAKGEIATTGESCLIFMAGKDLLRNAKEGHSKAKKGLKFWLRDASVLRRGGRMARRSRFFLNLSNLDRHPVSLL